MNTISFQCSGVEQLEQQLSGRLPEGFRPQLAIVFSAIQHSLEPIRQVFLQHQIDVIGCSTAGEIVDGHLCEDAIAVLLMSLDKQAYRLVLEQFHDGDVYQAAVRAGNAAKTWFSSPALLILSGGFGIDAEALVSGLKATLGNNCPIYGGLAGDGLRLDKTYAFTGHTLSSSGMAVLVFDTNKVSIQGLAISGWEPVGGENVITKADGNIVYDINGEPAYDVFTRYFGLTSTEKDNDSLIGLQTNYPFQFIREGGHSILRSPLLVDEKKRTIMLAASVQAGDKFRFSYSPGFEIIEQAIDAFGVFQESVPDTDAVVLFSCKGRHGAFGPLPEKEISGIYNMWKKPMAGFLSYGEIGNIGSGACEFHNETCSLVLIKER